MIPTYTPGFAVLLTRLVNRRQNSKSFQSAIEEVDLTPYLGDAGQVTTQKTLEAPCGAFSVTFADRINRDIGDTVYSLVEPMDMIEIRGARIPANYVGQPLPLIMRGFVSSVTRDESMGQDGQPQRVVRIVGQDSGKLLDIYRVLFEFAALIGDTSYIEQFKLQAMTGIEASVLPVADFMKQVINNVVNLKILNLSIFTNKRIKTFQTDMVTVPDGLVLPQLAASIDSVSMWQLMETFADRPWNELFVKDAEDGPHLVFRPTPYRGYDDQGFIMNGAVDPGRVDITVDDVVSISVRRSDQRVANFYWVEPGVTQLDSNQYVNMASLANGWPLDLDHDANAPEIYGQRKMQARTNLYPNEITAPLMLLPESARAQAGGEAVTWAQARGKQLMLMNQDNSRFEEGQLGIKGSEAIVPGVYLRVTRGATFADFYIEAVTHQMAPLSTWTCGISVIRGTGYRERTGQASKPYITEGRKGPYSR